MLDIGWTEMLVLLVVALFIVGPRDIPRALRVVGRWVGKVRGLAREFQDTVEDAVRESELDDVRKQLSDAQKGLDQTIDDGTKLKNPETLLTSSSDDIVKGTNDKKNDNSLVKENINQKDNNKKRDGSYSPNEFSSDTSNPENDNKVASNSNLNKVENNQEKRQVPQGLKHLSGNKENLSMDKNLKVSKEGKIESKKDS